MNPEKIGKCPASQTSEKKPGYRIRNRDPEWFFYWSSPSAVPEIVPVSGAGIIFPYRITRHWKWPAYPSGDPYMAIDSPVGSLLCYSVAHSGITSREVSEKCLTGICSLPSSSRFSRQSSRTCP